MRLLFCFVLASLVPLTAAGCEVNKACTALACANGIQVDFSHSEPGSYAVDVTVDGVTTTCKAKLPLDDAEPADACASAGIILSRSGSALPSSSQSIGGVHIERDDAKSVTIRVTRDGQLLQDATFTPSYVVTPGPNGPDCEPQECRSATFTLP